MTTGPFIEVRDLVAAYGSKVAVDRVSFSVAAGEHLSLLGPSGCGKSTLLRCIAGLEVPISGEILIGGKPVFSAARRINLPPEARQLAMVFQSYAIWPHLTVFENVAYGLRIRRIRGDALRNRVIDALGMIGMVDFAERPATELSGGQQQRVALARAYAAEPRAILLDEPLSNLDARLRVRMREELRELQQRVSLTAIYVTHDQEEAMAISDRIIVMRAGRMEQAGTPLDIYERPSTSFVADFIGAANLIAGRLEGGAAQPVLHVGEARLACAPVAALPPPRADGRHVAAVRTVYPLLSRPLLSGDAASGRVNEWQATVTARVLLGDTVSYALRWPGGVLRVLGFPGNLLEQGMAVSLHIPRERAVLVTPDAGEQPL